MYGMYYTVHLQTSCSLCPLSPEAVFHDIVTDKHGLIARRGNISVADGTVRKCIGGPQGILVILQEGSIWRQRM